MSDNPTLDAPTAAEALEHPEQYPELTEENNEADDAGHDEATPEN